MVAKIHPSDSRWWVGGVMKVKNLPSQKNLARHDCLLVVTLNR
jgi:hypothetical protein